MITGTAFATTTQASVTATFTVIETDNVAKKLKARAPAVTPRAILQALDLYPRDADDLSSIDSALSSACSCLNISPAMVTTTTTADLMVRIHAERFQLS